MQMAIPEIVTSGPGLTIETMNEKSQAKAPIAHFGEPGKKNRPAVCRYASDLALFATPSSSQYPDHLGSSRFLPQV